MLDFLTITDTEILMEDQLPEAQYHSQTGHGKWLSRSMIACYLDDPIGYRMRYVDLHPLAQFDGNASTSLGTIWGHYVRNDTLCLFEIPPEFVTASGSLSQNKASKAWQETLPADAVLVGPKDQQTIELMMDVLKGQPGLHRLVTSCTGYEVTVRITAEYQGRPVCIHVRLDGVAPKYLLDFKITKDDPARFLSSADKYGYDIQSVLYAWAWEQATGDRLPFLFLVSQHTYPWRVSAIGLSQSILENAEQRIDRAVRGIIDCDWGTVVDEPVTIEPSAWWRAKYEE